LQGTVDVTSIAVSRNTLDPNMVVSDTSYSQTRAAMRGDFLGTGEYTQILDPDVKQTQPDGSSAGAERSYKEYADFRIAIGLAFYF